jgi:3-hydroxyisobutyrate dehydrogenase-like beta-hydroxyacid dehydrogenase
MSETLKAYKIGFIGLGNMGWPMACHLHDAGADLTVWNRSEAPTRRAAERGMAVAADPAAVAEAAGDGIICLNLTHTDVVAGLVERLVPALVPGVTVIDFGTTGYAETLDFAAAVEACGGRWIDAPVSGGQVGAEAGNLTIMAGGEAETFARVLPVLQVVGGKVTHMGAKGAGQVTKLANQLMNHGESLDLLQNQNPRKNYRKKLIPLKKVK